MKLDLTWLRPAMCYLVKVRKKKQKEVAELFGVKPDTVSAALKRFDETGTHANRKGQGRKRASRDNARIEEAREHLQQNN